MGNTIINTNVLALNAHRNLRNVGTQQSQVSNRLSSGLRINTAADDAAGLAISERMRSQIRGLDQASRNSQDAMSLMQVAEGSMIQIGEMMQRVRELTVASSNDTQTAAERELTGLELHELFVAMDNMANQTQFNQRALLNGDIHATEDRGLHLQVGANSGESMWVQMGDVVQDIHNLRARFENDIRQFVTQPPLSENPGPNLVEGDRENRGPDSWMSRSLFAEGFSRLTGEQISNIIGGPQAALPPGPAGPTQAPDWDGIGALPSGWSINMNDSVLSWMRANSAPTNDSVADFLINELNANATAIRSSGGTTWEAGADSYLAQLGLMRTANNQNLQFRDGFAAGADGNFRLMSQTGTTNLLQTVGGSREAVLQVGTGGALSWMLQSSNGSLEALGATVLQFNNNSVSGLDLQDVMDGLFVGALGGRDIPNFTLEGTTGNHSITNDVHLSNNANNVGSINTLFGDFGAGANGTVPGWQVNVGNSQIQWQYRGADWNPPAMAPLNAGVPSWLADWNGTGAMPALPTGASIDWANTNLSFVALAAADQTEPTMAEFQTWFTSIFGGNFDSVGGNGLAWVSSGGTTTHDIISATGTTVTIASFNEMFAAFGIELTAGATGLEFITTDGGVHIAIQATAAQAALYAAGNSIADIPAWMQVDVAGSEWAFTEAADTAPGDAGELTIEQSVFNLSSHRALFGAFSNRLQFTVYNLDNASENQSAAEARIRDADMAREMMRFVQLNVLQQASISMLAQANQAPQSVLQLLG